MRKIININFQGRVIPIEESAYDILKQYVESLRLFFAGEEGHDEIINDIEGRIAELFNEFLKKGIPCITNDEVSSVINSIGRPEDLENEERSFKETASAGEDPGKEKLGPEAFKEERSYRLGRDGNDKILGGVCAGIANYFKIDPAIMRLLFAVITLGGFGSGFLLYILLWIVLPVNSEERPAISKRLYRNPDDKIIAGVASGTAAYFNVAVWIPRLIFAFPLVMAVLSAMWHNLWDGFSIPTSFIFSSFGGMFFLVYAILWIVVPQAHSASEKLEMRGEKVDLNSIKNTIQEDLESFKHKAAAWGGEVKQTLEAKGKQFGRDVKGAGATVGARLGQVLGILFKAFFLCIAGILAFVVIVLLFAAVAGGISVAPFTGFFLDGFWQNFLTWTTIILFFGIPVIGLLIWLIRRVTGMRSRNNYLTFILSGLWVLGLIGAIFLVVSLAKSYQYKTGIEEAVSITQPANKKFLIRTSTDGMSGLKEKHWERLNWNWSWNGEEWPLSGANNDSLILKNIQVRIVKSPDSIFHVHQVKLSMGSSRIAARVHAGEILFRIMQQEDSILVLPAGLIITTREKFHAQQVLVVIEVPVGKKIELDESVNTYNGYKITVNGNRKKRGGWSVDWDDNWYDYFQWEENVEYIMTSNEGLMPVHAGLMKKEL